jgi:hypothetical protein
LLSSLRAGLASSPSLRKRTTADGRYDVLRWLNTAGYTAGLM